MEGIYCRRSVFHSVAFDFVIFFCFVSLSLCFGF